MTLFLGNWDHGHIGLEKKLTEQLGHAGAAQQATKAVFSEWGFATVPSKAVVSAKHSLTLGGGIDGVEGRAQPSPGKMGKMRGVVWHLIASRHPSRKRMLYSC